jgi:ferrous iron transport protein A
MRLTEVQPGETIRIVNFEGGRRLEAKLRQMGLLPGDCLRVIRQAPFKGPLLVEVRGREIALGQGVTAKIVVEEIECASH